MEGQRMKSKQTALVSRSSSAGKGSNGASRSPLTISRKIAIVSLTRYFGVVLLRRIPEYSSTVSHTTTRFHRSHRCIVSNMLKIRRLLRPQEGPLKRPLFPKYLLTTLLATVLVPSAAHATEVALTNDAHVNSTRTTTNFGTLANLYVGGGNNAFLQFDLTTLPIGTTSSQVSRAILTVYVNRINTAGAVTISPVTSAWNELTVTYAAQPAIGAPFATFTPVNAGGYITIDVTSLVQGWITTPASNDGIALTSATAAVLLDSKENDETGHSAKLDITITSTGASGATGAQGIQGPIGLQGLPGAAGPQGIQGTQGVQGPIGPAGPIGLIGATGSAGATGSTGATGNTGAQGVTGSTGAIGATGAIGNVGATGAQGVTGSTGNVGATGSTGVTGSTGATGATGTLGIVSNWSSAITYQPGQVVFCAACSSNGSSYAALSTNTNQDPPTQTSVWRLIAMQGATGSIGIAGANGNTGAIGATGATGATGANGATGTTGSVSYQGVYSVSTTYAQNAIVSDSNHYNTFISLANGNLNNALPTSGGITAFWATLAAQGAQGIQGAAGTGSGTVTSVTAGTITNAAAQGAGSITITNTTTTPTLNVSFPVYTLPTELTTLNSYYTSGITGTGNGAYSGPANGSNTCTLGDTILSVNSYTGGSYLPADGRLLQIASYTAVFSIMGINFGGNGTSNFALPNLTTIAPPGMYYSICVAGVFPARY
jgi:hypothetical protein